MLSDVAVEKVLEEQNLPRAGGLAKGWGLFF